MKGFNKKSIITAMLISALACQIAQGASVKYEGNNINISGVISSKQKNLEVGIQIVGPFDSAIDDIDEVLDKDVSAEKELEKTYYTQIKTTDGGKYDFTLGGINNGKFYGVAIREPEGELITSKLYIAEQSMINIVLNKINTSGSSASIKEIFDTPEYYDMLVGNYTIFKSLSENDKNKVYNLIYEDKKSGFSNFAEFEKSIITSSAVVKTASETDPKKALAYSEEISFESADASLYEEYNKKNVIQKSEIIERVMKEKPANYKEYIERFNEACFLQKVQEETYSTNITKYMKEYESKFGFELSKYDSVSTAVNVKLCGNKYMKMSDFKTALANAIASSTRPESTSGGGGGGGSSTSSNKIINAPVVPDRPNILTNFDDLDNVPWAKDSIEKLANKGIVSGKEDRKFFPNDIIKREEFIKIAVSAFGLEDDSAQTSFADVPAGSWFFKYVAAGVKAGLIYGIDENNFGTGLGMTRQDLATIIYRYLTSQGKEIASDTYLFADDDKIADYAHEAVYVLKTQGILSGTENNSFEPQRYATRAEVARVIASLLSL